MADQLRVWILIVFGTIPFSLMMEKGYHFLVSIVASIFFTIFLFKLWHGKDVWEFAKKDFDSFWKVFFYPVFYMLVVSAATYFWLYSDFLDGLRR